MANKPPKSTDRRAFLTAEPIRRWWANSEKSEGSEKSDRWQQPNQLQNAKPGFLLEINKPAMACQWDALLNYGQYTDAAESVMEAMGRVDELEQLLSIFLAESEVSRLNALAPFRDQPISDEVANLLTVCFEMHQATAGAFDITSGPLTDLWKQARKNHSIPSDKEIDNALQTVGLNKVWFDQQNQTVRFAESGIKIDFGGIGKGYALQQCHQLLMENGIRDFLIHGGQSSVTAAGTKLEETTSQHQEKQVFGWKIGLSDPLRPEKTLGHFLLKDRALGTSGSARQFFHYKGKRLSHIFDPRTGQPAEGVLSSTVIAPDATIADALATSCFVLGPEGCEELCRQIPELAIMLVLPKGNSGKEIVPFGPIDQYWQPSQSGSPAS